MDLHEQILRRSSQSGTLSKTAAERMGKMGSDELTALAEELDVNAAQPTVESETQAAIADATDAASREVVAEVVADATQDAKKIIEEQVKPAIVDGIVQSVIQETGVAPAVAPAQEVDPSAEPVVETQENGAPEGSAEPGMLPKTAALLSIFKTAAAVKADEDAYHELSKLASVAIARDRQAEIAKKASQLECMELGAYSIIEEIAKRAGASPESYVRSFIDDEKVADLIVKKATEISTSTGSPLYKTIDDILENVLE